MWILPPSINCRMCRKKKVRSNVRMCAPSTSASVMMITLPYRRRAGLKSSFPIPGGARRIERPLPPRQFLRLARRFPRPGGLEGLLHDLPGDGRRLLEEVGQLLVDQGVHDPLHFAVPQAVLRLPIELGLGDFAGDHGGQPFPQVVSGGILFPAFTHVPLLGALVHRARERRTEADEMRSAVVGVDVVREGKDGLLVGVVVLEGHLRLDAVLLPFHKDRLAMESVLVSVPVLDKGYDPALVLELVRLFGTLV